MSTRLSYNHRLHYPWQYRRFFQGSEALRFGLCTVFRIKNELGHYRLGITLKARGRSVDRNRVKRQIRESFRKHAEALNGYDYNVVISAGRKLEHPFPARLGQVLRQELPRVLRPR
jgi:ribonuclease P protein component